MRSQWVGCICPFVGITTGVQRGLHANIATGASEQVQSWAKAASYLDTFALGEQVVPTPRAGTLPGALFERPILFLQDAQGFEAPVLRIDIEHYCAIQSQSNISVGPL